MKISIFGQGNMGKAIGENFSQAGNEVEYIKRDTTVDSLGEIVVLAVPYASVEDIITRYADELSGKIVVDITNPVNFATFDELVVPSDSSVAAEIADKLPDSNVLKAFNTNFAATLTSQKVGGKEKTTVLVAGDNKEAKEKFAAALEKSGLVVTDAGSLKRARELEATGFLQMTLAASEKLTWAGGFGVIK